MTQARDILNSQGGGGSDISQEEAEGTVLDESYRNRVSQKWGKLLEGIGSKRRKKDTAVMLENEYQYLNEEVNGGMQGLQEQQGTQTPNVGPYTKFIFPIIRRSFPELIANDLVSVQPMDAPVGAIFFYKVIYDNDKGQISEGDEWPQNFDQDYSSERVTGEVDATGDGSQTDFTFILDWTPVRGGTISITHGSDEVTDDGNGSLQGDGSGSVNYESGEVNVSFDNAPADGEDIVTDYEFNLESNRQMPAVRQNLELNPVKAETRHLKTLWSAEAAEDYRNLHGRDIEEDLVDSASQEIQTEIDRTIINDLYELASDSGNTAIFDASKPSGITLTDHLKDLNVAINKVSEEIRKRTFAGPANWIIVSPDVASLLDSTPFYDSENPESARMEGGIIKIGVLRKKWDVYIDPYLPDPNKIIVGRQGQTPFDTGYVYAPYVPLQVSASFLDPGNFEVRKGYRTRDAREPVKQNYYGLVEVRNL